MPRSDSAPPVIFDGPLLGGVMRLCSCVAIMFVIAETASAHHSPAAFSRDSQITIQGMISRLDWTNPHVYRLRELQLRRLARRVNG